MHAQPVVLIGMPGSGKSSVGMLLAKALGRQFVDTDLLIESQQGQGLQEIVDLYGYQQLRQIEEQVLCTLDLGNAVIATGGSVVHSSKAMDRLKRLATVVYLYVEREVLLSRITNFSSRGLAKPAEQSFSDLFEERCALYERYADIRIDSSEQELEQTVAALADLLQSRKG